MLPTPLPSATESNSWRQREIVVCSCVNGPRWIGRNFRVSNRPLMRAALGFSRKFLLLVDTFLLFLHWTGVRLLSSKNVTADLPSRGNAGDVVGDLVANLPFLRRLVSEFFLCRTVACCCFILAVGVVPCASLSVCFIHTRTCEFNFSCFGATWQLVSGVCSRWVGAAKNL